MLPKAVENENEPATMAVVDPGQKKVGVRDELPTDSNIRKKEHECVKTSVILMVIAAGGSSRNQTEEPGTLQEPQAPGVFQPSST